MTGFTGDLASPPGSRVARTRVRLVAVGVLVLVFVAGVGIGWSMARRPHGPPRRGGPPGPFGMFGRDVGARLQLTAAESIAVDSASKKRLPEAEAFWRGPGAQWRALLDSTRSDVRAALPAEKRVLFDSLTARGRRGDSPRR